MQFKEKQKVPQLRQVLNVETMEPSDLKIVGQSFVLALVIFISSFFALMPYAEHLAASFNCSVYGGAESYRECIAKNMDSWPHNYIIAAARTSIEFLLALIFGFLFTKSYEKHRMKNLALLALGTELFMIMPSLLEITLDLTTLFSFLLVLCALFFGVLAGNTLKTKYLSQSSIRKTSEAA